MYLLLRERSLFAAEVELQRRELAVRNGALAEEVVQQSGALQQLVAHLNVVRTDERATLARNLHDDLGQLLVGARIELANLERSLGSEAPAENLAHLQRILDGLGASAQRAVVGLRTESDDARAFSDELQAMLQPIQGRAIPEVRIDVAEGLSIQRWSRARMKVCSCIWACSDVFCMRGWCSCGSAVAGN
ncbi:MAG: histidine kinase [Myxococcota bacterium]